MKLDIKIISYLLENSFLTLHPVIVVSSYPQGICCKTSSRCLKLRRVPNPIYKHCDTADSQSENRDNHYWHRWHGYAGQGNDLHPRQNISRFHHAI